MLYKAYSISHGQHGFADDKWDFGFLKEAFDRNNVLVKQVKSLPKVKKAFVVAPGFEWTGSEEELNRNLNNIEKVVLFITSDELGVFDIEKISHPNIKIWVQYPYEKHRNYYKMPVGSPSRIVDFIPEYPEKKYDAFFSGQITHSRRKELAEVMPMVKNSLFNPTEGFTQGYGPEEYYKLLSQSKIVPCPAGAASIDSFRFFESIEMMAIPIGDTKSSSDESFDFWTFVFGENDIVKTDNWKMLPKIIRKTLVNYPANLHQTVSWWIKYKRDFANKIMEQINED
jgi:hypothetical protein